LPKGNTVEVTILADGKCKADGKFKAGPCQTNTARAHQIETGLYGGCGISTSRSEITAIFFATTGHKVDGYVYVIDETLLEGANVTSETKETKGGQFQTKGGQFQHYNIYAGLLLWQDH
jgi:hypothetical protein